MNSSVEYMQFLAVEVIGVIQHFLDNYTCTIAVGVTKIVREMVVTHLSLKQSSEKPAGLQLSTSYKLQAVQLCNLIPADKQQF